MNNPLKLTLIVLMTFIINVSHYGSDLHVGMGQPYSTIQEAVNAASDNDVIIIHQGLYREQVEIDKEGLTFQPNETDTVTVSGAEVITTWTHVGDSIYSAIVDWNVTEADQSNQVFIDGEMIHQARWPKRPAPDPNDFVTDYELGRMESASLAGYSGEVPLNKIIEFTDNQYDQDSLWVGAKIWLNLSNPTNKKDGQGHTGEVVSINGTTIQFKANGRLGDVNWGIDTDTRYYFFDPLPSQVIKNGGVSNLLAKGEWWKNRDTLYIKTKDGNAPSSTDTGANVVEVKKRIYAFIPAAETGVLKNTTIKNINIFAATITTDRDFEGNSNLSDAKNNVIDGINAKYLQHFVDLTGHWGSQWSGRSGIILSGTDNLIRNSTLTYTAGSAISCMGISNKIHNNYFDHCNYQVTESANINFGFGKTYSFNHDIGYNTIVNTPHEGINLGFQNLDERSKGVARIHHNVIHDGLLRIHDSGLLGGGYSNFNWMRIDHNILYNSVGFLRIGVYADFGDLDLNDVTRLIIDHNVMYNIDRPIQMNHCSEYRIYNNTIRAVSDNSGILKDHKAINDDAYLVNNIAKNHSGDNTFSYTNYYNSTWSDVVVNPDFSSPDFQLVETSSTTNNVINKGTDVSPFNDSIINGSVDIGAYEYKSPKWGAGYYGSANEQVSAPSFSVSSGSYPSVALEITTSTPGAIIRYTTNGKTPTTTYGNIYNGSFNIPSSCKVMAVAYKQGQPESFLATKEYKITSSRPAENPVNIAPGLKFMADSNYSPSMLDFEFLPHVPMEMGIAEKISLDAISRKKNFDIKFSGYIKIHEAGEYTFYTISDDGCQLFIGNTLLINNSGNSDDEISKEEVSGSILLDAGLHKFTIKYSECDFIKRDWDMNTTVIDGDVARLSVKYSGPGVEKCAIPDVRLYHEDASGDDVDPEISIIKPFDNAFLESGRQHTVLAEAYDAQGIDSVEFIVDGDKVYNSIATPHQYTSTYSSGTHSIITKAYDVNGNTHLDSINVTAEDYEYVPIKLTHTEIVLDGYPENVWDDSDVYTISNKSTGSVSNANDLSGDFRILYKAEGLYFIINVTDDDVSGAKGVDQITNNDGVEIFLDLNNGKTNFYQENDFHYILTVNNLIAEQAQNASEKVEWVVNTNPSGYAIEAMIPWETIDYFPMHNDTIGFEVKIIDSDEDRYEGKCSWWETSTDQAKESTSVFGIGILIDQVNDTVAPGTPVVVIPQNGDTATSQTPIFKWEAVSDPSGILRYELDISGTTYSISGDKTTFEPSTALSNGNYTWKLRAVDKDSNSGDWTSASDLVIDDTHADTEGPGAPELVRPYDGVNLDSVTPVFSWKEVYDVDGIEKYEIQINDTIIDAGNSLSYHAYKLPESDSAWKVRAIDVNGNAGTWSETRLFYLKGVTNLALNKDAYASSVEPGKTTLDGANDGDLDTRWGSEFIVPSWYFVDLGAVYEINKVVIYWQTSHATVYDLQVSNDSTNWTTIYSETDGEPEHIEFTDEITGLSDSGRYIRMYAIEKDCDFGVSMWEFEVYSGIPKPDTIAPAIPVQVYPAQGDTIHDITPLYKWKEVIDLHSGIDKYEISIDDSVYSIGAIDYFNSPDIVSEGDHTWKIRAIDGAGNESGWSTEYTFTFVSNDTTGPTAPALYRPLNGFISNGGNISLIWYDAADESGIDHYEVMVGDSIYDAGENLQTSIELSDTGSYMWKVRAYDIMGNQGIWSEERSFSYATLGIDLNEQSNIVFYPNPAQHTIYISSPVKIDKITITDLSGKVVTHYKRDEIQSIDVSDLSSGLYILTCQTEEGFIKKIFIKE